MSFRITCRRLNQQQKESETKNMTLNMVVNQIVKEYIDWHGLAAQAKFYYIPKAS